jgi:hypothetical protein
VNCHHLLLAHVALQQQHGSDNMIDFDWEAMGSLILAYKKLLQAPKAKV